MSHEIRNPLNSVTILACLLEQADVDDSKRKQYARRITSAARSVTEIIDDILDFAKLEAGQVVIEAQKFELDYILSSIRSIFSATAEQKGLGFHITEPDLDLLVIGDRKRLQQVLVNLVGNAIKFTNQGSVWLRCDIMDILDGNVLLMFDVSDTGIGIEQENIDHISEPFSQADTSITRRFGGSGLGLSISKGLIEMMGGQLDIKSTPGLGSSFRFTLNLPIYDGDAIGSVNKLFRSSNDILVGRRILMVDDDRTNIEILSVYLEEQGAQVTAAFDGSEAINKIQASTEPFDMVLMDIQMPVMDGISATRKIREELGLTELPIIAITGGVLPDQQQRALESGITSLLMKPVEPVTLIETITALMRARSGKHDQD
jgi:CheY-like chemotaxis protein